MHVRLGPLAWTIRDFWREMSEEGDRDAPRRAKTTFEPKLDNDEIPCHLDTEGSGAHLVDVIAHNTLKEIIFQAKETVRAEHGRFRIPSHVMDELLVKCEKILLNYGEEEAKSVMVHEIRAHLDRMREFKERDDDRKVRERLPSSMGGDGPPTEPAPPKNRSHRRN